MKIVENELIKTTTTASLDKIYKICRNEMSWEKSLKMPLYYISTRDSFAFDLV